MVLYCLTAASLPAATPEQYDSALASVQNRLTEQVRALDSGTALTGEKPGKLAARVLAPMRVVELPDGTIYRVNTSGLIGSVAVVDSDRDMDRHKVGYQDLIARISAIRRDLDLGSHRPIKHAPGNPAVQLRAVLSRSDFQSDPLPEPTSLEVGMDRFLKWLSKLFHTNNNMPPPSPINPAYVRGLLIALATALFVFIVWLIVRLIQQRDAKYMKKPMYSETEAAMVEARDTDSLLSLAERHARDGDYRTAFRLVYISTLVALDSGGVLRFDRSRTNWEYLRTLRHSGQTEIYESMLPLTRDFDRLWYGSSSAGAGDYHRALEYYKAITLKPETAKAQRVSTSA